MNGTNTASDMRSCEWCATSIPVQATKCPKCGEWRRDVQDVKQREVTLAGLAGLMLGLCVVLLVVGLVGEHPSRSFLGSSVWYEKASIPTRPVQHTGQPIQDGLLDFMQMVDTSYEYRFSVRKFLGSPLGWAVIATAAIGALCVYGSYSAHNSLKYKLTSGNSYQ